MKKSELKQIIKEQIREVLNEGAKILSQEFGGYDDVEFLKVVWQIPLSDLKKLLEDTMSDLVYTKNVSPKGKIMGSFTRRDISIIKNRIKFLKQIISHKEKDPEFIPTQYR